MVATDAAPAPKRMTPSGKSHAHIWNSVIPADLVLLAALIAYLATAIGAQGPMAVYGHDDANRAAAGAWLPIPLHLATAALLATGRPVLRIGGGILVVTLLLWTAFMTIPVLGSLGHGTDLADVGIVLVLLASYGGAAYLTFRSVHQPERSTEAGPPAQVT